MPAFFSQTRGTVVRIDAGVAANGVLPFSVRLPADMQIGGHVGNGTTTLTSQTAIGMRENFQLQPTLGDTTYAYSFGEMPLDLRISGIAFSRNCQQGTGQETDGLRTVLAAYDKYRLSQRRRTLDLVIGTTVFRVILGGATFEIADAERQIGQWGFQFFGQQLPQ